MNDANKAGLVTENPRGGADGSVGKEFALRT